jgi:hypothetical protein
MTAKITFLKEFIEYLVENVLDQMGAQKVSSSIRGSWFPVYAGRDDGGIRRHRKVMRKVRKNLQRKAYSSDPPRMGL